MNYSFPIYHTPFFSLIISVSTIYSSFIFIVDSRHKNIVIETNPFVFDKNLTEFFVICMDPDSYILN